MLEGNGDLFQVEADAVVITTNGYVKSNGCAVMGRGCAQQASIRFEGVEKRLGKAIKDNGNVPHVIWDNPLLISFPVKPISGVFDGRNVVAHMGSSFKKGDRVPGWAMRADPDLILESAKKLVEIADKLKLKKLALPRPGCGAGELEWDKIKPMLEKILDDRFTCYTF